MELSPSEETLVNLLRGSIETDFALNVTRTDEACVITLSTPTDGVLFGAGLSFEEAFLNLCERVAEPGIPPDGEAIPRPSLTLVGGMDHDITRAA